MSIDPVSVFVIVKWIGSLVIEQGQFLNSIPDEVYDLQNDLQCMLQQLEELDIDPGSINRPQHSFAEEIRKLAFRSEDVIDYYLAKHQPKIKDKSSVTKFSCILANFYPIYLVGNEIDAIRKKLRAANERLNSFPIANRNPKEKIPYPNTESLRSAPAKALHVEDDFVVGIKEDIQKLVVELLKTENGSSRFVAIVGTGGAGKTTIARNLYNDIAVQRYFEPRVLVSISKIWSVTDVLIEIARQAMGMNVDIDTKTDIVMKEELRGFLGTRKYLIVIDDIWELSAWNDLSYAFPKSHGSKIILTTRIRDVPLSIDNSSFMHEPRLLNRDEIYELIQKIAIEGRSTKTTRIKEFERLAWDMSGKCSGIPLSAVSLAGALSVKNELYQWETVQKNLARYVALGRGNNNYGAVEDMLALSYIDLPSYLKPCLLYLATFPEDFEIYAGRLIRLWIGEGFVTTKDILSDAESLEEAGIRFLDELVSRCLLSVIERNCEGKVKKFKVHDLVRDFVRMKAEEQWFLKTVSFVGNRPTSHMKNETIQARRIVVVNEPSSRETHEEQNLQTTCVGEWKEKDKTHQEILTNQGVRSVIFFKSIMAF